MINLIMKNDIEMRNFLMGQWKWKSVNYIHTAFLGTILLEAGFNFI